MKVSFYTLFLLVVLLLVFLSQVCTVPSCDARDTSSFIVIRPFVSPAPVFRPNTCSFPPDGISPNFYQGPWSANQSALGFQNATFNFFLTCTNPDCGDGGIINRFYSSGNEALMGNGGTASIDEVFNSNQPILLTNAVYRSSCNRAPCSFCETVGGPED